MSALYGIGDPNGGDLPTSSMPQVMGRPVEPMVTFEPAAPAAEPAVQAAPSTPPVFTQNESAMVAPISPRPAMAAADDPPQKAESSKALTVVVGLLGLIALSYWLERATKR